MAIRFRAPQLSPLRLGLIAAMACSVAAGTAFAEAGDPGVRPESSITPPDAPAKLPRVSRSYNIDFLFEALKAAPDEESAKAVEGRIWALWLASGSDTTDLLMTRAKTAMDSKDYDLAIRLLDAVITVNPDYAEGWNRRATVYFLKKDYGRSIADIRQVLAREPRHFGALTGLGTMLQEVGDEKRALEAFRRALAVNPRLQKVPDLIKSLTEKVDGRDI